MVQHAVADLPREVETPAVVLEVLDHAKRLLRMAEGTTEEWCERLLPQMSERCVAQIVPEGDRLRQILVEAQCAGDGARDMADVERVGQSNPVVIPLGSEEHLRLVFETAERLGMDDPVTVALEAGTDRIRRLGSFAATALGRQHRVRRERVAFDLL